MDFEDTEEEISANYAFQHERKEKHIYPFIYNLIRLGFKWFSFLFTLMKSSPKV